MAGSNPKVFVTHSPVPEAVAELKKHFDVEVWEKPTPPSKSVLKKKAATHAALLTQTYDLIDEEVLVGAKELKVVANRGATFDNINVAAATSRGILVATTPDLHQETCADMTFGLILAAARRIALADRHVRAEQGAASDQTSYLGMDVHGKTLGIVGLGRIGMAVARRSIGFDMRVLYNSRVRNQDSESMMRIDWTFGLQPLLAESDFVSLHVPLTDKTRYMIGRRELKLMQPTSILVNTSHSAVVDNDALCEALTERRIAGAALDVSDPEAIPSGHPLLGMDNVVLSPHIADASAATFRKMSMLVVQNIIAALNGDAIPSCVNPEVLNSGTKVTDITRKHRTRKKK
ncbi:MAG: D-glycerate dehydrogenase [Chloroflexi bacterium]|nr:D-glycerate dehydrogenase [Chloroflexota bacterium]